MVKKNNGNCGSLPPPRIPRSCCCGPNHRESCCAPSFRNTHRSDSDPRWVTGRIETPSGIVQVVNPHFSGREKWQTFLVRCGIGRMSYTIDPGLYALGNPDSESPVFVSANFKLSFDHLRSSLNGIAAWILVLDTKGINVWCAAGKGSFGTAELVRMIEVVSLERIVSHRRLILPQLGAPGIAAHEVRTATQFKVLYGPVRAADISSYLAAGMKTTDDMRRVRFSFKDRAILAPVELFIHMKYLFPPILLILLLSMAGMVTGASFAHALYSGLWYGSWLAATFILSVILIPLLLPWLPGRAFSLKGAFLSLLILGLFMLCAITTPGDVTDGLGLAGFILLIPALTSFIAMNFTGSSTFTSLSGVLLEMRKALPFQVGLALAGTLLWITGRFVTV